MALRNASLVDLYAVWTMAFTLPLTISAFFMADNDLRSIAAYVAAAVGCAQCCSPWSPTA